MTPRLIYRADLTLELGAPTDITELPQGTRQLHPITGGSFSSPRGMGTILAQGGDQRLVQPDGYTQLYTRFLIDMGDSTQVNVTNTGILFEPPGLAAARKANPKTKIDPEQVFYRSTPRFETNAPEHDWLTKPLFITEGTVSETSIELKLFEVL
jgi:hypothetical protein